MHTFRPQHWSAALLLALCLSNSLNGQSTAKVYGARTRVVVLGSGNPAPGTRLGPAVAIIVDSSAYLFDAGAGVMHQWSAALQTDVARLNVTDLRKVFITHLHSDHTLGYPDLLLTSWTIDHGRSRQFDVYGPTGLKLMTDHILAAFTEDIAVRTGRGGELQDSSPPKVQVHEIAEGSVYRDSLIEVIAFQVPHGTWRVAFGYEVRTPDKIIVLSGDTGPTDVIVQHCNGCDILFHEGGAPQSRVGDYFKRFHTTGEELARVANLARPKLLVLYHQGERNERTSDNYRMFRAFYSGAFVVAQDLDIYY